MLKTGTLKLEFTTTPQKRLNPPNSPPTHTNVHKHTLGNSLLLNYIRDGVIFESYYHRL